MENGAEEAEHFETPTEIAKSADLEDASLINDHKTEEVHEIEKNFHSNEEESTPAGDTEIEPTPVHKEPETMAAESTEGNPPSSVEEVPKEEKTADETISAPEVDTAIVNDTDGNIELPTSHEELSKESEKEFPEEKMEANDIISTPESVETTSIAENEHVEIPAANGKVTMEENGLDSIPSTEDDKETEPATTDEEHVNEEEAVGGEIPSGSAATLAVDGDERVDSLAVHEEAPKEEIPKEELPETPATVEETGIEETGVEPAIEEEELLQENVTEETQSKDESPEAASVVQDEKPVSAEADEADAGEGNTEVKPLASGFVSVEATAAEEEKDSTPGVVNEEPTEDDGPADDVTGEASQDLESAAPHEDVKPEELESAPESIETIPVEDAKNVEPETLHSEEIAADESTSTIQSAEAIPHVEKEGVEVPTSLEEPAEKSTATEESAAREIVGSIPAEDTEGVEPEPVLPSESTEANPSVEDRGMEAPALDEESTQEGIVADELGHAPESVQDSNEGEPERVDKELNQESAEATLAVEDGHVDTTPPHVELDETAGATEELGEAIPVEHDEGAESITADGLDREEKLGDEIPSADAIPAVKEKDVEIHAEDANGTEPSSAKDEEVSGNEIHSAEDLAEATPAVEDKGLPTPHDEPAKEEITDEVARSQESVAEEVPSTTASEDAIPVPEDNDVDVPTPQEETTDAAIPAVEDKEVEAPTAHEELAKEETTDEVAQHPESVEETPLATAPQDAIPATEDKEEETVDEVSQPQEQELVANDIPLASSSEEAIPASEDKEVDVLAPSEEPAKEEETTDESVPQSQDSAVEETPSGMDSEDVIPAAEDRNFEAPTSHAELTKDDTGRDDASLVSDSSQSTTVLDDLVEGSAPNDELSKEETTDESAQPPEFVEADAKEVQPVTEGVVEQTTDDVSQPLESVAATLTEDRELATGEQEVHSVESAADEIPLLAASDDAVGAVEDKDADMPTPHEEHADEETTGEVVQSQQSVVDEIPSTTLREDVTPAADDKEVVVSALHEEFPKEETSDETAQAQETVADEVPSTVEDSIPTAEDKDVDAPAPDEEPAKDEDITDEDLKMEPSAAEEVTTSDSPEPIPAVAEKNVEVPTSHEEPVIGETIGDVSQPLDSDVTNAMEGKPVEAAPTPNEDVAREDKATEVSSLAPVVESEDVESPVPSISKGDVEEPGHQEQLSQEDTITPELPVLLEDCKDVEPEKGTEEHAEEKISAERVSSTTDSTELVRAAEVENEELPTSQKEPEDVTPESAELTSKSEVAAATAPTIEDKDVEFPTQLQLSKELPVADEVPPETTEPAQAPEVEPATSDKELINAEAAPVTEESMEEANDLSAEPAEIIDKHVLTADSLKNGALATETPEAEEPHADGDKLKEQEILLSEKPNGPLTDVVQKTVDAEDNPAATVDAQDGHEASAVVTISGAKATQGRDLDPGLLRERDQEKVQNVAQEDLEEEDKVSVPLSTHASDLSSSWVNVSPIQSADIQSASAGFHSNLSQGSHSGRPENDLGSGGDDWRIVSEHDLGPSKSKDSDTGLSRPKFPFSIVLWCTQSMSTLFGGSQR